MFGSNKPFKFFFGKMLFFAAMATIFVFVLGTVVMYLWNAILPEVIGAKPLTFWKAVGLLALTRILFGGFRFGGHRRGWGQRKGQHWRNKWMNMSEMEKTEFKDKWKERCKR